MHDKASLLPDFGYAATCRRDFAAFGKGIFLIVIHLSLCLCLPCRLKFVECVLAFINLCVRVEQVIEMSSCIDGSATLVAYRWVDTFLNGERGSSLAQQRYCLLFMVNEWTERNISWLCS